MARLKAGHRIWTGLLMLAASWLGVGALPASAATDAAPLTIFAAASLKESLDEASRAYQQATGVPVRISYAGSSALARQIEQGAPADVFVSADLDWMDYLQQKGRVVAGDRRNLLGNRLVVIAPKASAVAVDPAVPRTWLPALGQGRLAVALTGSVPAGKYAKAALQSTGAWPLLQARLAEAENVRSALMLVARGEAPLGIVYASDAQAEPRVRIVATFPPGSHPPIVYPAAALQGSRHADALAFVQWLGSPTAAAIFRRHGFHLPVSPAE